jgi:hypothetical protein
MLHQIRLFSCSGFFPGASALRTAISFAPTLFAALVSLMVAVTMARADVTVDFEHPSLSDGTIVTIQFASLGVNFSAGLNPQPTYFPVIRETRDGTHGASRSGSNVLQVPPPGIDFAAPALLGILAKPQASISLWVRNVTAGAFKTGLQLRAFDANGRRVDRNGSAYAFIASGSTGYTRLTATSAATNIASFLLATDPSDSNARGQRLWIDDLNLDIRPVAESKATAWRHAGPDE